MFQKLVSHNDDIRRLVEKGYAVTFDTKVIRSSSLVLMMQNPLANYGRGGFCLLWCRRRDLNPHALADTAP